MTLKLDSHAGMAEDQTGPIEKIQNGDYRKGANRDQRSQAREAGGPGGSLQRGVTGTRSGQVPPHEGLVHKREMQVGRQFGAVRGETVEPQARDRILEAGALDRSGHADYQSGSGSLDSEIASNSKGEPSDTVTTGGRTTDLKTGVSTGDLREGPAVARVVDHSEEEHASRVGTALDKEEHPGSIKEPIGGGQHIGEHAGEGKGASGEASGSGSAGSDGPAAPPHGV